MTNNNLMNNNQENNMQKQSDMRNQMNYSQAELNDMLRYSLTYPEIYYKAMPFVMLVCDQVDTYTAEMPSQDMVDQMTDNVVEDITRVYPDMAEYANNTTPSSPTIEITQFGNRDMDRDRDRDFNRRRFRRRTPFNDFIQFLILSELFKRRRRY